MKDQYTEIELKWKKSINVLHDELATVRAGRANPAILDKIMVDYYGVPTPINQIGTINVAEARALIIQPWDATILREVEKAILASDIGLNPNNDGKMIRLNFPQLNEERRKELVKQVHKYAEGCKVAIRSIRRDAIELYKAQKKKSEITEDDLKDIEKDIQDLTNKYIAEIDHIMQSKEKEIMEV